MAPQPVLLEVNYSPDFGTVSRFYPDFVNEAFELLFRAPQGDGAAAAVDPQLWEPLRLG